MGLSLLLQRRSSPEGLMDPETEKHFASLIMEEAARLRLQAEKEGVHAYLAQPRTRGRPNPQFLKATVRGIEQANRAAEVSEMWKVRAMELELEGREKKRDRHRHRNDGNARSLGSASHSYHDKPRKSRRHGIFHQMSSSPRLHDKNASDCTLEESYGVVYDQRDDAHSHDIVDDLRDKGLKEDEVEQFLHARVKRGRGTVGSRMDETGPYPLPHLGHQHVLDVRIKEDWEDRVIGPSREVDKGQSVESKERKKRKRKVDEDEDYSKEELNSDLKKKEKRRSKKKHRSLHKKSKKKRRGDSS